MDAATVGTKRILQDVEEAKSPHRILVRSLLNSRNKLRAKYRELRAECKRWRNQATAVERSRSTWRERHWPKRPAPRKTVLRGRPLNHNCNSAGNNQHSERWS